MEIRKLKKPLIICIVIGQMLFQGITIPFVSLPLYLCLMIVLTIITFFEWAIYSKGVLYKSQSIAINFILTAIVIILSCLLSNSFPVDRIMLIVTSFFFCKACYDVCNDKDDRYWLINFFITVTFCSAVVEIGQFLGIGISFDLWAMTHQGAHIEGAIASERYLGMSPTILHFGYVNAAALALTLFTKFKHRNRMKKIVLLIVFFISLMTNNTRSAMIAVIFSFVLWVLNSDKTKNKNRMVKILIVLVFGTIVFFISDYISLLTHSRLGQDEGYDIRISMLLTGINHIIHYPFGMGTYTVQNELIITFGNASAAYIQTVGAHNIFCNIGGSYGVISLILMISLYLNMWKLQRRYRKVDMICTGTFVAILGLFINANFHNLNLYTGDIISYMLIGVLLSYQKEEEEYNEISICSTQIPS